MSEFIPIKIQTEYKYNFSEEDTQNKVGLVQKYLRYYQIEADNAILNELVVNDNHKCLVKMFCGTGKSLLMRKCKVAQHQPLAVYVFPSLPLIKQFYEEYLYDFTPQHILKISSDNDYESTTDDAVIQRFLSLNATEKIICVTYQSYETLLTNLHGRTIDICIYDEAHHAVGQKYQQLIFGNNHCRKQIFFTATPKNDNGIIMYDRTNVEGNMCGKLVYDYPYLRGVYEDYLNPFEIRIEMFTENTNKSLYETISRSILSSGNNRVLTFHSDVNTDRDLSVKNFVNEQQFITA